MANQGRLKNLPPEKRELLNRLLRERTAPADAIQRRSAGMSRVPVSSGQRRIWFLDRMEPGLPVYQISATLPLGGGVDPEVMERSVNGLVARHESLRTTFSEIDGELFQITTLIDSIAAQPHLPISSLRFIATDEEQRILHEWNATAAPFPAETRVEKLVTEQAARSPDATAIICAEGEITYRELCREANQIARNLLSRGIERGSRIGIFLERGRCLLPALLGTWAAGCAYVPLDTGSPVDHTQYILEDANLAAVLTEEHLRDYLPSTTRGLICLDREEDAIAQESGDALPSTASASDAAYILYTSGSTGQPKGVIVAHRSLVNYLTWTNRVLAGPSPRLLPAITKITFDASLKQLFAPLFRGGAVWLIPEKEITDLSTLMRTLSSRGDFALNCVPWLWSALLDTLSTGEFSASGRLKQLLVGGEELSPELLKRTFARFPELEVWNLYGPTETTANATGNGCLPKILSRLGFQSQTRRCACWIHADSWCRWGSQENFT
jgi:non-ribosomal peptide synthetase component F